MKKVLLLTAIIVCAFGLQAQNYTYMPWNPSMGELNFNTLGDAQHPYAQCKISSNYNNPTTVGIQGNGSATSHALITDNAPDPCRCTSLGTQYVHESYLPPALDGTPGAYEDTAVRIGCGTGNSVCYKSAQIEYWFYPQPGQAVLEVMASFAAQNTPTHGVNMGCGSLLNPQFYIEVLDGETDQLLQTGHYPTQASAQTANPVANVNWPYSRFLAWPSGCSAGSDTQGSMDNNGIVTYYWAGQNSAGYATPTTYTYRECPSSQTGGNSTSYSVVWFEYIPYCFDLSDYAALNADSNQKSVKLRIHTVGCSATAHWIYGLFTAKMIPSEIPAVACGDEDFVLSVPNAFMQPTYEWHFGYDSVDASSRILDAFNPPPGITVNPYSIVIDPSQAQVYPYYRCEMKSRTGVPFSYEAHVKRHVIEADFSYQQDFSNGAPLTAVFQNTSTALEITPPTMAGGTWDTVNLPTRAEWFAIQHDGTLRPFGANLNMTPFAFDTSLVDANGIATVILVVSDWEGHCSDTVIREIQLSGVGIPTHTEHHVSVLPNPTTGLVRVTASSDISDIRILNADGKLIETVRCGNASASLDLSRYPGSLFLLDIRLTDGTSTTEKVVVKR